MTLIFFNFYFAVKEMLSQKKRAFYPHFWSHSKEQIKFVTEKK